MSVLIAHNIHIYAPILIINSIGVFILQNNKNDNDLNIINSTNTINYIKLITYIYPKITYMRNKIFVKKVRKYLFIICTNCTFDKNLNNG